MRIGLIVNPLAGLGGPLALKGSDAEMGRRALAAGATAQAGARMQAALDRLAALPATWLAAGGAMGEDAARAAGLAPTIVHRPADPSGADDTVAAARALAGAGAELIVFAGGDGTARDLLRAEVAAPVFGIPAGVKMHSAVFAGSPASAAAALADLIRSGAVRPAAGEVLDRPHPDAPPQLYGVLPTPAGARLQPAKAAGPGDSDEALAAAAALLARQLGDAPLVFVGPGATMRQVKRALGAEGTLLGVDAYCRGRLVARDADAGRLAVLAAGTPPVIVLGVVGGQGFLLGRGNQQLSAAVVARAGRAGLRVLASAAKLAALPGGTLRVDSGDAALDTLLAGHLPVITGPRRSMMMRVEPA